MKLILERRPSPAMIVAVIALITALTGSAYAGGFLSAKKYKNQAVRGPVTYVTELASSIPVTPAGVQGTDVGAFCPPGLIPLGGGISVFSEPKAEVIDSHPRTGGWTGTVKNTAAFNVAAKTTVICAVNNNSTGSFGAF